VETTEEVEASSTRLAESGLVTFDERDTTCCYARQDKVWVSDPAGNRWEVYTVLEDVEEEEEHEASSSEACCRPIAVGVGAGVGESCC
jgi:hypothetical protein